MAQTYSNAYITILASNAGDAAHGFLAHRDPVNAPSARIPFRIAPNRFGTIIARKYVLYMSFIKEDNPLTTRAWALQEQMMANRILAYTKHTLQWRCAASMMSLNNSLNVDFHYDPMPELISQLSTDPEEALSKWLRIVRDFSHRHMSIESDKLPAIAALAERFAAVLGHYYAGLWQYGLIKQLSWFAASSPQRQRAASPYRAPSWSWASVNEVYTRYYEEEDCCNLVSAEVLPKNAQVPYGEVVYASIKIRGKVSIASLTRATENLHRMDTLIHFESEVAGPPLQRFYRAYFCQDTKSAGPGLGSAFEVTFFWDEYERFPLDSFVVCKFSPNPITSLKQL